MKIKKKIFICLLSLTFSSITGLAKDTTNYPIVNMSLETGVKFLGKNNLDGLYGRNVTPNYGLRLSLGKAHSRIRFDLGYNLFVMKLDSAPPVIKNFDSTSSFMRHQAALGINIPISINKSNAISLSFMPTLNWNRESINEINETTIGMLFSIEYSKRLTAYKSCFFRLTHDFNTLNYKKTPNNWSSNMLNFGFTFNLAYLDDIEGIEF